MEADAEIISIRTEFGMVSEWKGGKIAYLYLEDIQQILGSLNYSDRPKEGDVIEYGHLKVRILKHDAMSTRVFVMLESPHAQLYWLYREKAQVFLKFIYRCESAVHAFMLRPFDGRTAIFTSRLADKLL